MKKTIITNSSQETHKLGADFARNIKGIGVLALYGDLGSGKTTFIQGLAKGLGIQKNITSPTFIIMRSYNINLDHQSSIINNFYHIDLYRIKNEKDTQELGLIELMKDSQNLFAIEWPEKIEKLLPRITKRLYFKYIDEDVREIKIV